MCIRDSPFTEPSAEVDVQWRGRWLEVMGCGMVDPAVLEGLGLDPERYSGFAAGLGVERFCMVRHGIDDIRRLYTSDLRFLEQFCGLHHRRGAVLSCINFARLRKPVIGFS